MATTVQQLTEPQVLASDPKAEEILTVEQIADRLQLKASWVYAHADQVGAYRAGKYLRLQWKHIDLTSDKLRIEQSLWSGQIVPPKTVGSSRIIPFGAILREALTQQCKLSRHTGAENFVFCKSDGAPLQSDILRRDVLYPALDRLGISRSARSAGFHTFRHSAGSFINAETGNLKLAQKLLGHTNLATTADIYTHTTAEAEREAALAIEQAIFGESVPLLFPLGNKSSNQRVN